MKLRIRLSRKKECYYRDFDKFSTRDSETSQNLNNDTFCRLLVTSAQYSIGTEK